MASVQNSASDATRKNTTLRLPSGGNKLLISAQLKRMEKKHMEKEEKNYNLKQTW